jgi:hypothetical protein
MFPCALLFTGCGLIAGEGGAAEGGGCELSTLDQGLPGAMVLSPSTAAPGEVLTVKYTARMVRSDDVLMYRTGGAGCAPTFYLYADATGLNWLEVEGSNFVTMSTERKPSSLRAVVPDVAKPGVYVVCEGAQQACALLTVHE